MYRTKVYTQWQGECDDAYYEQIGHKRRVHFTTPVAVTIAAGRPDRRKRDLDNINKALLDVLQRLEILEDDALVYRLVSYWDDEVQNAVLVTIHEMGDA